MGLKYLDGNLINLAIKHEFDIIGHGCNCQNTMNSGIALSLKNIFPLIEKVDQETIKGDKNKLGKYSKALYNLYSSDDHKLYKFTILNCYTQYNNSRTKVCVDYKAIESVMKLIKKDFGGKGLRLGFPKLGAGLAMGDWSIIEPIIKKYLKDENVTIVNYVESEVNI